ncbi:MAG: putative metal-dependent hydrolase [Gemmatimonadaceae bacterium]
MSVDLRYPVGRFAPPPTTVDASWRRDAIASIAAAPAALRRAVQGLTNDQLATPYRPDGWTVRQVVHHVFDSHLNAYARLRLALTENQPTIRPYDESAWAELPDAKSMDVEVSLQLLELLHRRFVALWESMAPEAFARMYVHPESGAHSLDYLLAMYEWHGRHHVAHITTLRTRERWS